MSLAALFAALDARPDAATLFNGGDRIWSAAAVRAETEALAVRLRGCRSLAILADNGPAWAIADLAALRAGVPVIPLPPFFSPTQIAHVLEQTGVDAVFTDQPDRITGLGAGFVHADSWQDLVWLARPAQSRALPAGTAKVSFTSGSTGTAKGVCLSADGLADTAAAITVRLADLPIHRHLAVLPLALLLENSAGIYAPLLRGAEIALPPLTMLGWQGMSGFDPARLYASAQVFRPHSMILVPELLKAWSLYLAATGRRAPAGLTYVAVGGARVAPGALDAARRVGIPAYQGYGLTECGSVVAVNRPGDDADDVGRPLDHATVRIADGEVVVATRAFLGYLGDSPEATAGPREFATGDLGSLTTDGHLQLSGRRKNLLITSFGRNVAPEWVEAALLAQPAIAQAIVAGEARPWLSALLVPAPGTDNAALAAAVATANTTLPDYARIATWSAAAPFTLANGQATGNGRPLRTAILSHYAAALAALYEPEETQDVVL